MIAVPECRWCRVARGEYLCEQVVWRTGDLEQDSCDELAAVEVTTYKPDGEINEVYRLCSEHGKAAALAEALIGRDVSARGL